MVRGESDEVLRAHARRIARPHAARDIIVTLLPSPLEWPKGAAP